MKRPAPDLEAFLAWEQQLGPVELAPLAAAARSPKHEPGDVWKGAFVEIGAALASGIPIHLVGDPPGSWTRHPLVVRHVRLDRAVAAVTGHR